MGAACRRGYAAGARISRSWSPEFGRRADRRSSAAGRDKHMHDIGAVLILNSSIKKMRSDADGIGRKFSCSDGLRVLASSSAMQSASLRIF